MLTLNAELERVIQKTQHEQRSLSAAASEQARITADLASTNAAIGPLQLDVDKLHYLLQAVIELNTELDTACRG